MEFQKLLIKTAYWLVAISILVIIGLTIFSGQLIKKQSENPNTETITGPDSFNDQVSEEESTLKKESDQNTDLDISDKTYSGDLFQTE